jgi:predicted NBD/HSP70 family sugar kinase
MTRTVVDVHHVEQTLAELAGEVAARLRDDGAHPVGAAVAVPGLIAEDDRTVAWTPNLGITGTSLATAVDEAFGWQGRTWVGNDADCGALAELHHGAGRSSEHLLYLTGTVGIGAGIIEGGRLVRGARGFAGEVGHLPIGEVGARCGCGRLGCWEATIGLHAVLARVGLPELSTPETTARAVAEVAERDPTVRASLEDVGEYLGRGLAILAGVLDPAVIVLGGYFGPLADVVLAPARELLAVSLAAPVQEPPDLRPGRLGTESAALGAAERALEEVYAGRIELAG